MSLYKLAIFPAFPIMKYKIILMTGHKLSLTNVKSTEAYYFYTARTTNYD